MLLASFASKSARKWSIDSYISFILRKIIIIHLSLGLFAPSLLLAQFFPDLTKLDLDYQENHLRFQLFRYSLWDWKEE